MMMNKNMKMKKRQSSRDVFRTTELIVHILQWLPLSECIVAQRVTRVWRDVCQSLLVPKRTSELLDVNSKFRVVHGVSLLDSSNSLAETVIGISYDKDDKFLRVVSKTQEGLNLYLHSTDSSTENNNININKKRCRKTQLLSFSGKASAFVGSHANAQVSSADVICFEHFVFRLRQEDTENEQQEEGDDEDLKLAYSISTFNLQSFFSKMTLIGAVYASSASSVYVIHDTKLSLLDLTTTNTNTNTNTTTTTTTSTGSRILATVALEDGEPGALWTVAEKFIILLYGALSGTRLVVYEKKKKRRRSKRKNQQEQYLLEEREQEQEIAEGEAAVKSKNEIELVKKSHVVLPYRFRCAAGSSLSSSDNNNSNNNNNNIFREAGNNNNIQQQEQEQQNRSLFGSSRNFFVAVSWDGKLISWNLERNRSPRIRTLVAPAGNNNNNNGGGGNTEQEQQQYEQEQEQEEDENQTQQENLTSNRTTSSSMLRNRVSSTMRRKTTSPGTLMLSVLDLVIIENSFCCAVVVRRPLFSSSSSSSSSSAFSSAASSASAASYSQPQSRTPTTATPPTSPSTTTTTTVTDYETSLFLCSLDGSVLRSLPLSCPALVAAHHTLPILITANKMPSLQLSSSSTAAPLVRSLQSGVADAFYLFNSSARRSSQNNRETKLLKSQEEQEKQKQDDVALTNDNNDQKQKNRQIITTRKLQDDENIESCWPFTIQEILSAGEASGEDDHSSKLIELINIISWISFSATLLSLVYILCSAFYFGYFAKKVQD